MYISDICKDLREKFNYGEGGLDHGLLYVEQGLWLSPIKMLGHYDLKFADTLEFRKKHRILKVKTLDNSIKNVLIDDSANVKSIVDVICARIGIANSEEYSLMRDEIPEQNTKKEKIDKEKKARLKAENMIGDSSRFG
jgi:talin